MKKKLIQAGKIVGTHKLQGALKILFNKNLVINFDAIKSIFVGKEATSVLPYFTISIKDGLVSLEDITTIEQAQKLVGQQVWLESKHIEEDEFTDWQKLIGYTIVENKIILGAIEDIMMVPSQELFVIKYNNKEVLIPAHIDFIEKIDKAKKQIIMQLPEGLLEVYMDKNSGPEADSAL